MSNHVLPVPVPELVEGELVEGASTSSANGGLVGGEPASDPFAPHGPGRARTEADLHDLAAQGAERFADANTAGRNPETVAREVLAWASQTFGTSIAVACSMAGDTVVAHLAAQASPGVDVLFLQTGYHFPETIGTRDALAATIDAHVIDVLPRQSVAEQDATHGPKLHDRDPSLCCALRKTEPINRELASYEAWITGLRREDSPLRAATALVEWDAVHAMVKINPIATWTFDQLADYAGRHAVPINLLLGEGYPSIGCAPCTRPVAPGEDPRAGRWAGLAKTECGLHVAPTSKDA
ncbi:MAG TPA: phosphoadenylyl-sulfate reductase [Propioniciclava tarda]|nr:phosphoadenylyl-sulfate reductase [Propioniciclava tarda]HQD61544.1 phosphoadenylyl-sulfate reductase [Propioniciclava tarda]